MSRNRIERGREYLLWDGSCAFCARGASILKNLDAAHCFVFVPHQEYSDDDLHRFGLSRRKCEREIQVVTTCGRNFGGAFALNYFFAKQAGWKWLIALSFLFPVVFLVEVVMYRIVAQNRALFSEIFFRRDRK